MFVFTNENITGQNRNIEVFIGVIPVFPVLLELLRLTVSRNMFRVLTGGALITAALSFAVPSACSLRSCSNIAAAEGLSGGITGVLANIKTFTLENGLTVVVVPDGHPFAVTHMVIYMVGGADDPSGKSGIAHYLEHLMFKSTKGISDTLFSEKIEEVGGEYNAFTSHDYTVYYERILKQYLGFVMNLEADRMVNLDVKKTEAATELNVVLEERLQRVNSNPRAKLMEALASSLYVSSPYRIPVLGWKHELEQLSVADVSEFYKKWYAPENAIVVVLGNVDYYEVKKLAEKNYGWIPKSVGSHVESTARIRPKEPDSFSTDRSVSVPTGKLATPSLLMSWRVPSRSSGDTGESEALTMLCDTIGGRKSSLLYRRLVRDKKIATHVNCFYDDIVLGDTSFLVSAIASEGASLEHIREEIESVFGELRENNDLLKKELVKSKNHVISAYTHIQDSQQDLGVVIGTALATGSTIEDLGNWHGKIHGTKPSNIIEVMNSYIRSERLVTGYLFNDIRQ